MRSAAFATAAIAVLFSSLSCARLDSDVAPPPGDGAGANLVEGNPTCESLGLGSSSITLEQPTSGTYELDAQHRVTIATIDGRSFDWSAHLAMDAVIAQGETGVEVYVYEPEAASGTGLHAPLDSTGRPQRLVTVQLCFDYEVEVSATAGTSFTRTFSWSIGETSSASGLTLARGETYLAPFDAALSVTGSGDSDWMASGVVSIHNPAPFTATVVAVSEQVGWAPVPIDCGVTFPYELPAFSELSCSYSAPLPSAETAVESATASTSGPVGPGAATATADFTAATVRRADECVTVTDDHAGYLGDVCAYSAPLDFHYSSPVGPYSTCGATVFVNTATAVGWNTGAIASGSWTIPVDVPCDLGCTLPHGYWKTHSSLGPAPYDAAWALRPQGAGTPFFSTGLSEYQVLWMAPEGNSYWLLARQYIAAELNQLNGAAFEDAAPAFASATALLSSSSPEQVASAAPDLRASFLVAAAALDDYNSGRIGPGHCSE